MLGVNETGLSATLQHANDLRMNDQITLLLLLVVGVFVYAGVINLLAHVVSKNGDWFPFEAWKHRQLIDGSIRAGSLYRRWTGTQWEYREPTRQETQTDSDERNAW